MSKERELLKRVRDALRVLKQTHYSLYWDIQTALDQPEQEPVAWRWKTHKRNYYTYSEENYHELEGEPLYTSPPKRMPLSEYELMEECDSKGQAYISAFIDGVEFAEKAHGIGGR